jgi:hypothetical protein
MSCRLEGVPMVDTHDGLFSDWCELNFVNGVPEAAWKDLEQDYDTINLSEETQSAEVDRTSTSRWSGVFWACELPKPLVAFKAPACNSRWPRPELAYGHHTFNRPALQRIRSSNGNSPQTFDCLSCSGRVRSWPN